MKVYLATVCEELERCERYTARLRAVGVELAYDWMTDVRKSAHRDTDEISRSERRRIASARANGVVSADVFWLLTTQRSATIGWVELGVALGSARPEIIVSGPKTSIFVDLVDHFTEHEHAFDRIVEIAERVL